METRSTSQCVLKNIGLIQKQHWVYNIYDDIIVGGLTPN